MAKSAYATNLKFVYLGVQVPPPVPTALIGQWPSRRSQFNIQMVEWQTRKLEVLVAERLCRFESGFGYQLHPFSSVDRAPGYELGGRGFDSLKGYQKRSSTPSGCSAAWQRTGFGFRWSWVRIPPPRPNIRDSVGKRCNEGQSRPSLSKPETAGGRFLGEHRPQHSPPTTVGFAHPIAAVAQRTEQRASTPRAGSSNLSSRANITVQDVTPVETSCTVNNMSVFLPS